MFFHSLAILSSATIAIASGGVFNPPKAQSFLSIDYQVGIPFNTTTPNGVVGTVPVRGGAIKGSLFQGHVVPNLTSSVERYLPAVNDVVSTSYDGRFVFENEAGDRIFAEIIGSTVYEKDLHGFGYAKLETDAPCLRWINTAMFVAEWHGVFFRGSGTKVEIFQISTGGRLDGQPIHAIPPSTDI